MRTLELLSPARTAEIGRTAILAGADAVYIGAPAFGARAAATNTVEDIKELTAFAHQYRAKVYVTLNTILYDDELAEAEHLVHQLYSAGVDALIVQDMAYLEMKLPPIALHASTQCDIRTPEKAALLAKAGFSQLVLPREFTLEEIKTTAETAGVPVEVFVHGALCVSFSGDCQAGCVATGRSANRGACPQMCRLPYELIDETGKRVAPPKHYLSLRDLNQMSNLASLVDAGASSFKIEGRLKDARYVANVTAAYSRELNRIIASSGGTLRRSSFGQSDPGFEPDLRRTFNRGYTNYFLNGRQGRRASLDTPKWAGMEIGTVSRPYDSRRGSFMARLSDNVANGDGLGYFDNSGNFNGFRLNRAAGSELFPATPLPDLKTGMKLYRNVDKAFFDLLDRPNAGCRRTIKVNITAETCDNAIILTATDERACSATVVIDTELSAARSPQEEQRLKIMSKTGDTIYTLAQFDDRIGNVFVPASILTNARRELLYTLDRAAESVYVYDRRRKCSLGKDAFEKVAALNYHDNVANRLAERFYRSHGAIISERAIEVAPRKDGEIAVMNTRYCIRRELGACLKESTSHKLPSKLFLRNDSGTYRIDCDCKKCGMTIVRLPRTQ